MSDYENVNMTPDYENVKADYTPTTEDIRERFILGAMRRRDLEQEVADWDAWLASVKAEAWDEGFTYGETYADNPYRQGEEQ